VAFRKAIFAEPLDLAETMLGEFQRIVPLEHAVDEALAEIGDLSGPAERRHGPAQPIGLRRREAGGGNGDLHGLLLEQRHPERPFQDGLELGLRIANRPPLLHQLAVLQVGMHHIALDRPRSDDRHLDHQVVEDPGFQPRQHAHLRPAFDLEDTERIGPANHVIDIFARVLEEAGKRHRLVVMAGEQLDRLGKAGEHAERQDIDLQDLQRIEIVLVPLDHVATVRRVHDRHDLVQPVAGDDEAADMLRQMAREAHQARGIVEHAPGRRIGQIETGGLGLARRQIGRRPAPDRPGQRGLHILRQAEDLGRLAPRRTRPVVDDRRRQRRMFTPIGLVDEADHLLAPRMLEVDVDIRRLVAFGRDEAIEQQRRFLRIHLGNPETIADGGIGGRSSPLAEDAFRAGKADDAMDGEEIGLVAFFADQVQLVFQEVGDLLRNTLREPPGRTLIGQPAQRQSRRLAADGLVGILMAEFVEGKIEPAEELRRRGDRLRIGTKKPGHFPGFLQMPFGMGLQPEAGIGHRHMFANGRDHVGERLALRRVIEGIIAGDQRQRKCAPHLRDPAESEAIEAVIARNERKVEPAAERRHQPRKAGVIVLDLGIGGKAGHHRRHHQIRRPFDEIAFVERADTLLRTQITRAQHAAKVSPATPVHRIGGEFRRPVGKDQPCAGTEGQALDLRRRMQAHHPGHRIAIGKPKAGQADPGGCRHQFLRMRGSLQEGEIAAAADFEEGRRAHAKMPCMNQLGRSAPRS